MMKNPAEAGFLLTSAWFYIPIVAETNTPSRINGWLLVGFRVIDTPLVPVTMFIVPAVRSIVFAVTPTEVVGER